MSCDTGLSGPYCSCVTPSLYSGNVADFINDACGASDDDTSRLSTIYYLLLFINVPLLITTLRRLLNMDSLTKQLQSPLAPIDRTSSGRTLPHAMSATANQSTTSSPPIGGTAQPAPSQPLVGGSVAAVAAATDGDGHVGISATGTMNRPPLWLMCIRAPAGVFTYALLSNASCGIIWCILRLSGQRVGADIGISIFVGLWIQCFWLCPLLFGWSWFRLTAALAPISGITDEGITILHQSAVRGRRLLFACGIFSAHAPVTMLILVGVGGGASSPDTQASVLTAFMIMQAILCITMGTTMVWLAQRIMKVVQLGEPLIFDDLPAGEPSEHRPRQPSQPGTGAASLPPPSSIAGTASVPITIIVPPSQPPAPPAVAAPVTPMNGANATIATPPGVVNASGSSTPQSSAAPPVPVLLRGPSSHNITTTTSSGAMVGNGSMIVTNPSLTINNNLNALTPRTPRDRDNTSLSVPGTPSRPPQYQALRVITSSLPGTPRAADSPGRQVQPALVVNTNTTTTTNTTNNLTGAAAGGNGNNGQPAEAPYLRVMRTNSTITRANILTQGEQSRPGNGTNGGSLYESQPYGNPYGNNGGGAMIPSMSLTLVITRQLRCTQFTMALLLIPVPIAYILFGVVDDLLHRVLLWFPILAIAAGFVGAFLYQWIHNHTERLATLSSGGTITVGMVGGGMARISGANSGGPNNTNGAMNNGGTVPSGYMGDGPTGGPITRGVFAVPEERPSAATQILVQQRLSGLPSSTPRTPPQSHGPRLSVAVNGSPMTPNNNNNDNNNSNGSGAGAGAGSGANNTANGNGGHAMYGHGRGSSNICAPSSHRESSDVGSSLISPSSNGSRSRRTSGLGLGLGSMGLQSPPQ